MRPLTTRSVIASALLGMDPPKMPVRSLIRLTSLFGLSENRTRVALSRMVAAGELTTDGRGIYGLHGDLLERQRRQRVSQVADRGPFDGSWHMVVLTSTPASPRARASRRSELRRARFAEQRDGVWLRPANLRVTLSDELEGSSSRFLSVPFGDPTTLAESLFDLEGWDHGAADLEDRMAATPLRGPEDLAAGFVLSAAVLRHLQADPLLPEELLSPRWPGARLRERYRQFDTRYRSLLAAFHRSVGSTSEKANQPETLAP